MNDEVPKPKRKRRRRIIVGTFLLLVFFGWWCWPRADARFVGKWAWQSGSTTWPIPTNEFYSSGRGECLHPADTEKTPFYWHVKGDKFFRVWNRLQGFNDLVGRIRMTLLWRKLDWLKIRDVEEYDILEVTPDVIRLRFEYPNKSTSEMTLRRISE
jgi:hypothetical protein